MNTPSERFRLFVAIRVPESIKAKLEQVQRELRAAAPDRGLRWTSLDQMHLTLRFLGDVGAERLEALSEALRGAGRGFSPLQLRAEMVGFFPDDRFPRVVWAGVRDAASQLTALHDAVQNATASLRVNRRRRNSSDILRWPGSRACIGRRPRPWFGPPRRLPNVALANGRHPAWN